MNRDQLRLLIQGPIATLPTAFDAAYALDTATMAELTEWWVQQGLRTGKSVVKVAAAMGEGPDLDDSEWPKLLETVVNSANGRVPVVCGLRTKNTLHTIEDARRAHRQPDGRRGSVRTARHGGSGPARWMVEVAVA